MSGGQAATGVAFRDDLKGMTEELSFDELGLMGDKVATPVPVTDVSAYFPTLPREAVGKVPDTRRQSDGSFQRGQWEYGQDTYISQEYGFEEPIDITKRLENLKWFDEETQAAQLAVQGLKLGRVNRIASALFNTTTFTGLTGYKAITEEWDDATSAVPWADIDGVSATLRKKCGIQKKFQSLILTWDNIDQIIRCDEITGHAKYVEIVPMLPMEQKIQWLASYFGVKEIVPVMSVYDAAAQGVDFSYAHSWSNEYGMICVLDKTPNLKSRTVICQPVFTPYAKDYLIESYEEPKVKKQIIRAAEHRSVKTRADFGVLIGNMKTTVSQGV